MYDVDFDDKLEEYTITLKAKTSIKLVFNQLLFKSIHISNVASMIFRKGERILISYVDIMLPTYIRQKILLEVIIGLILG